MTDNAQPAVPPARRLAHHVVLNLTADSLTVDGHEFPYWIAPSPRVEAGAADSIPQLHLALMTDNLTVITEAGETIEYASPWPPAAPETLPDRSST